MKIFISWSGASSRMVAEELSKWLKRVIQAVEPFYSPDIEKGAKWSNEVDAALEGTRFGIICLTPDNLGSDWVHYEAGALSKTKDASIWTFLLDLKPSDVKQPLGKFQSTVAEKSDVLKLLKSINSKLSEVGGRSLSEILLEEIFDESWTKLETKLNEIKSSIKKLPDLVEISSTANLRSDNDKLDEVLELLRNIQRDLPKNKIESENLNETTVAKPGLSKNIIGANFVFEINDETREGDLALLNELLSIDEKIAFYDWKKIGNELHVIIKFNEPKHIFHAKLMKLKFTEQFKGKSRDWHYLYTDADVEKSIRIIRLER